MTRFRRTGSARAASCRSRCSLRICALLMDGSGIFGLIRKHSRMTANHPHATTCGVTSLGKLSWAKVELLSFEEVPLMGGMPNKTVSSFAELITLMKLSPMVNSGYCWLLVWLLIAVTIEVRFVT